MKTGGGRRLELVLYGLLVCCSPPASQQTSPNPERMPPQSYPFRTIVDSRGKEIRLPRAPRRVATVSDALVEEIMTVFGVQDRLVGIGSTCLIREFEYHYETARGETFSYRGGMNPALFLNRSMQHLPLFVRPGTEINYETLAGLEPDVVIIDLGSCTLPWRSDPELMLRGLGRLESLGIPTVVLKGLNAGESPRIEALFEVVRILGEVFDRQDRAAWLADYLEASVESIRARTATVPDEVRPRVLLLGLDPLVRGQGAVGRAYGSRDVHNYLIEEIVHGRNAYQGPATSTLSFEHLLALDPDVIILPTANGFHPPRELYEVAFFDHLGFLKAVQNRRVGSLPWSPCNCDKRLELPIDAYVMAKTVYPGLFEDLILSDKILEFYRDVYGADDDIAEGLLRSQWLEWTRE